MLWLAVPLGVAIGLVVGAIGGGGAILALPVLVYVLGEGVGPATTASLIVVAFAAAIGSGALAHDHQVCWRTAFAFAGPAVVGSLIGTVANTSVSARSLILAFVPIMLVAAAVTWHRAGGRLVRDDEPCPPVAIGRTALAGSAVGTLTGFFGVGGGFLIVPALTMWFGMSFRHAVATSLVVITFTALFAVSGHIVAGAEMDVPITFTLAVSTGIGALTGAMVGGRLPQRMLGRAFAVLVVAVAVFLLVDTLLLGGPPQAV